MTTEPAVNWLLSSSDPWVRYRTLVDVVDRPTDDEVLLARQALLNDPRVKQIVGDVATWPGPALTRHNDASHPIHKLGILVDFGVRADDPGMPEIIDSVTAYRSTNGAFQSLIRIPKAFKGTDEDMWGWMLCDAPVLLSALLTMGFGHDPRIQAAVSHVVGLLDDNGWRCVSAPELGDFRGPGRKTDPCPIANVLVLKALSQVPELLDSSASRTGAEVLLSHWEQQSERKMYLFGIGTDFRKLKYPFIWYDILHVVDVLSRFPFVRADTRFQDMLRTITSQADVDGRYRAGSMYTAWKGWDFADKKAPSPWITYLVIRILKRIGGA